MSQPKYSRLKDHPDIYEEELNVGHVRGGVVYDCYKTVAVLRIEDDHKPLSDWAAEGAEGLTPELLGARLRRGKSGREAVYDPVIPRG